MASIPIVGELADALKALPKAVKELPASQAKARSEILDAVTSLAEAVAQALNVVNVRCGQIILNQNDLRKFKTLLVHSPEFLNDFRLHGVCAGLGKVRAELRTILSMKRLSIRLFYKKRLERLLEEIQHKERDLEEDFDRFFRDLSKRATRLKRQDVPDVVGYLRDCQNQFEDDAQILRKAMRVVEESL